MIDYKGFMWDFHIADHFGISAIKDTYNRAFKEWKNNVEYFTALVITLNHQIFNWYNKNEEIARVYNELWEKADGYAYDNFKGEDLSYFLRTTD